MDSAASRPTSQALSSDLTPHTSERSEPSFFDKVLEFIGIQPKCSVDSTQDKGHMSDASRLPLLKISKQDTLETVLKDWVSQAQGTEKADRLDLVGNLKYLNATLKNGAIVLKGNLDLYGCPFTSLPENLKVEGDLYLNHSTVLTSLPEGLSVGGNLHLSGCTALTSLSETLSVGGDLNLSWCAGLLSLPENLSFGGDLELNDCTALTSLPNWITTLGLCNSGQVREVDISNTGLSEAILTQLRDTNAPGMRFIESQQASTYTDYGSLEDALKSWNINATTKDTYKWHLNTTETEQLTTFLSRMHATSEATNAHTTSSFKNRVQSMMSAFDNDHFRELAMTHIHDALSSCDDRILLVMDNIDITQKIETAKSESIESINTLGQAMHALDLVDEQAQKHIEKQNFVDPIEVILALRIHLANEFNLPITTRNMKFECCANLTPEIIQKAKSNVQSALKKASHMEKFLAQWQPMQQAKRNEAAQTLDYKSLKSVTIINPKNLECCITGYLFADIDKPVVLASKADQPDSKNPDIVALAAVLRQWVEKGTHLLTNQTITLSELQGLMYQVKS